MIQNVQRLDFVELLGSRASAEGLQWLFLVIEHTNFTSLPDDWLRRGEVRSLVPGRRRRGGDYLFYNPHNERALSYNKVWHLVRAPSALLPTGYPVDWYFDALAFF